MHEVIIDYNDNVDKDESPSSWCAGINKGITVIPAQQYVLLEKPPLTPRACRKSSFLVVNKSTQNMWYSELSRHLLLNKCQGFYPTNTVLKTIKSDWQMAWSCPRPHDWEKNHSTAFTLFNPAWAASMLLSWLCLFGRLSVWKLGS